MKHVFLTALTAASIGIFATAAPAQTFTAGTTENYTFGDVNGLGGAATLDLTLQTVTDGSFLFSYVLTNNSDPVLNPDSRVPSFGFNDVGVDVVSATTAGEYANIDYTSDPNIPNHGVIELCLYSNGSCTGGPGGATLSNPYSGTFTLNYADTGMTSVTLDNFYVRYQSLANGGSSTGETGDVPEPSTWAMMLIGFGGIGYSMRRQRKLGLQQLA